MTEQGAARARGGNCSREYTVLLVLVLVTCVAAVRYLAPESPGPRSLADKLMQSAVGLLQCFGIFVGVAVLLACVEFIKQAVARHRQRRVEDKLSRLRPVLQDGARQATADVLRRVLRLLGDGDPGVRQHALGAAYCLLRANPALVGLGAGAWARLERALVLEPGFPQTLHECGGTPLQELVTLGAKVGAGTSDKRISPVTSDPTVLARWVHTHRNPSKLQELQVSVGYDTGTLPFLSERGKFIALYLYVASTDLRHFQALAHRPTRDPNAAFGLLIRGDVVEVRFPGQSRGRRLDYVFPLPAEMTPGSLAEFLRGIQLLNLGLLAASAEDLCRALLGSVPPGWLTPRVRAVARVYRGFERRLVALLRQHDRYREPGQVHRLQPCDHAERVRALTSYRLEQCLYPEYGWVVPLYGTDTRWDRLLPALRAVEALMLHQGEVEGRAVTRGLDFIQKVRLLGYESAAAVGDVLAAEAPPEGPPVPADPFIDPSDEEATTYYLRRVGRALAVGEASPEDVPDPNTFRQAAAYYRVEGPGPALASEEITTDDPRGY